MQRVLIAGAMAVAVFMIPFLCTWLGEASMQFESELKMTYLHLPGVENAIRAYRREYGVFPASLKDLLTTKHYRGPARSDPNGDILDGWGRPFAYSHSDDHFEVISLGRDGKPGGVGLDHDLSSDRNSIKQSFPTLRQFLFELPTQRFLGVCALAGLLAGVLTFQTVRSPKFSVLVLFKIALTFVGAAVVAMFISFLHIPTGH
jgi:hypothetical protein